MKALIIASGQGLRLKKKGDIKPLIPLLGLPILERVILCAREGGIEDFLVVVGYRADEVEAFLEEVSKRRGVRIRTIRNEEWDKENGLSVLKAKKAIGRGRFLLLMGDHLFDPSIVKRLSREKVGEGEIILAIDRRVRGNPWVDMEDVTRVLVEEGRIRAIGKDLDHYNAFDTGIFLCTSGIFAGLEESLKRGDTTLSGGVRAVAEKGRAKAFDIQDAFWIDIDTERAFHKAEGFLMEGVRKATDGPVSRFINRPLSTRITKRLVHRDLSPNQVSLLSFFLALLGALFFLIPGYSGLFLGAILTQMASIIDGCDGEIARLKHMESDFGGWFDAVLDRYADAFLIMGLTIHASRAEDMLPLFLGLLAITGTFMNSYTADKYDGLMRRLLKGRPYLRLGRDVRLFIISIGALTGKVVPLLLLIALLMNGETLRRVWVIYRERY